MKNYKFDIENVRSGWISYFDLGLQNVIIMACLCHLNKKIELLVEDFWDSDELQER